MKKVFILLIVTVIAIAAFIANGTNSYRNLPPTATGDWIAYGDSLTSGYGSNGGHDYPTLLSQRLGVPIRNFGIEGNTTADGVRRLDDAIATHPRVVLLCLGGNDGLQRLPADEMVENLDHMISAFQSTGSFVVLIGVHSASLLDTNDKLFKALAKRKHALYVPDMLDGVLGTPSLMADQIHPNDAGYEKIVVRLEKVLKPLLPKLTSKA